tara:strand:+ start:144 stop:1043 length:900 start_codon:yes stop_codon:yes gene_type:complete
MPAYFDYSPEVASALRHKKPILALESTLITHGLPYPHNVKTAIAVEQLVREMGVTPATIAIMSGKIKIGLTPEELSTLVSNKSCAKASKRDIPYVLSQNISAGTTVAATLFAANHAGIKVFATGGIGGVHHGDSDDISADIIELANTPVAVICAGAKAILDLPRTMEFLETYSIPVVGYRTETLPAFYTSKTSHPLNCLIENIPALVKLLNTHWQIGMKTGILITNPIPSSDEIPSHIIEPVIAAALVSANEHDIRGKELTPYLLNEIATVTQGKSMAANISLIKNNARLGAELALSLG